MKIKNNKNYYKLYIIVIFLTLNLYSCKSLSHILCSDFDKDGICDKNDACPKIAGLKEFNGCPDTDSDGIADTDDKCPNEKGTNSNRGCPDTDGDGVLDIDDKCPFASGPAANSGCPWLDSDGDAVLDKDDKCINEAGPASNSGCPQEETLNSGSFKLEELSKEIKFEKGASFIINNNFSALNSLSEIMNESPSLSFLIEGHTDNSGNSTLNKKIAWDRANNIKNFLVAKGIDSKRLLLKGFGESSPIASNSTAAGRAENRRIEIKVIDAITAKDKIGTLELPIFEASDSAPIDKKNFEQFTKLEQVNNLLTKEIGKKGYTSNRYLFVNEGFAIVTQMEQIDESGTSLDEDSRWVEEIFKPNSDNESFFGSFFSELTSKDIGYYRVFIIVVTAGSFGTVPFDPIEFEKIENNGGFTFPTYLIDKPFTNRHSVTIHAYEFKKSEFDEEVKYNKKPKIGQHIKKSEIIKSLK